MTLEAPNAEQLQRIYKELGMTPEGVKRDVQHLVDWVLQQPHLPEDCADPVRLEHLLFSSKNSLEKVKQAIDLYYTVRGQLTEFYEDRDPLSEAFKFTLDNTMVFPLPRLTPEGHRTLVFRVFNPDTSNFVASEVMKLTFMVGDLRLQEDISLGDILIFDLRNISLGHLSTCTLPLVKKFMFCGQKAFPIRQNQVHLVYAPSYADKLVALFKPFLSEKLAKRFYVHQGLGDLLDYVPISVLPEDYGGKQPSLKEIHESWRKRLIDSRNWFLQQEKVHTDESKRPGKPTYYEELQGIQGSFRTLSVD